MAYDTYLCHHGILGQKWGVRRYQNKDGSYTPQGKAKRKKWWKNGNYEEELQAYKNAGKGIVEFAKKNKRAIAAGAALAASGLAMYGSLSYLHNINHRKHFSVHHMSSEPLKDKLDDFGTSRKDVKLPKGTKFQRISTEATEDYISRGHTYVSHILRDNLRYRKEMPVVLGQSNPYIHTLKANTTIKAPSRRVAAEMFLSISPSATYADYMNFMTYRIRGNSSDQQKFISTLQESGYNAVIDENDAGGEHPLTKQPLILINPNVTTTNTHKMSRFEKVLTRI